MKVWANRSALHCKVFALSVGALAARPKGRQYSDYTTDDAQEEYTYRAGKIAGRIKFITDHAFPLHCHGCGNDLLPSCYPKLSWYGDDSDDEGASDDADDAGTMLYDDWQGENIY